MPQQRNSTRVNQRITAPSVRLIDTDGTQLGIKPIAEAITIAKSKNLDLVEIAAQATPPVCKILEYSKFLYDQEKKELGRGGRQMQHRDLGMKLLMSVQEKLGAIAVVEQAPAPDRNRLVMTLAPKHA
ncbi:MAG: translation initiation factor IF-3 [Elusimicrobia bacterium]|nr:translation initiation factor IF-3 [Elusimicrobiota bacterium]